MFCQGNDYAVFGFQLVGLLHALLFINECVTGPNMEDLIFHPLCHQSAVNMPCLIKNCRNITLFGSAQSKEV